METSNYIVKGSCRILFWTVIMFAIVWGLIFIIDGRIKTNEKQECFLWQKQAVEYADYDYYLTQWQRDQCEALGVPVRLPDPVKRNDTY